MACWAGETLSYPMLPRHLSLHRQPKLPNPAPTWTQLLLARRQCSVRRSPGSRLCVRRCASFQRLGAVVAVLLPLAIDPSATPVLPSVLVHNAHASNHSRAGKARSRRLAKSTASDRAYHTNRTWRVHPVDYTHHRISGSPLSHRWAHNPWKFRLPPAATAPVVDLI